MEVKRLVECLLEITSYTYVAKNDCGLIHLSEQSPKRYNTYGASYWKAAEGKEETIGGFIAEIFKDLPKDKSVTLKEILRKCGENKK